MSSDAQVQTAAIMLAGRFYKTTDAPFGVVGSLDLGVANIRARHPDVDAMLHDVRGQGIDPAIVWPTAEEVAQVILNTPIGSLPTGKQDHLARCLQASIDWLTSHAEPTADGLAFGIA